MELTEPQGALGVLLRGIDKARGEGRVDEAEGELGLSPRVHAPLSGAQPRPRDGEPLGDP
ncbi:hypothetical protein OG770_18860 [Streptomyces sp. NBC_01185]|nr:hypothetical protein OG770_18860 [Streptomyces sp. NBC_01185]